jgi:hypothetical protein
MTWAYADTPRADTGSSATTIKGVSDSKRALVLIPVPAMDDFVDAFSA